MNYKNNQSIFIQIGDRICEKILNGEYKADERILSVREMAVEMEVNPNTVMRTYERLQANNILYNKRGIGVFVAPEAEGEIRKMRHQAFMEETLPDIFREMQLLGVSIEEVVEAWRKAGESSRL